MINFISKFFSKNDDTINSQVEEQKKDIKYLTCNGFQMRMTIPGFEKFKNDNSQTLKHWSGLWDENKTPYFKYKVFSDFVLVYIGKDFSDQGLRKYIETNYEDLVFKL